MQNKPAQNWNYIKFETWEECLDIIEEEFSYYINLMEDMFRRQPEIREYDKLHAVLAAPRALRIMAGELKWCHLKSHKQYAALSISPTLRANGVLQDNERPLKNRLNHIFGTSEYYLSSSSITIEKKDKFEKAFAFQTAEQQKVFKNLTILLFHQYWYMNDRPTLQKLPWVLSNFFKGAFTNKTKKDILLQMSDFINESGHAYEVDDIVFLKKSSSPLSFTDHELESSHRNTHWNWPDANLKTDGNMFIITRKVKIPFPHSNKKSYSPAYIGFNMSSNRYAYFADYQVSKKSEKLKDE